MAKSPAMAAMDNRFSMDWRRCRLAFWKVLAGSTEYHPYRGATVPLLSAKPLIRASVMIGPSLAKDVPALPDTTLRDLNRLPAPTDNHTADKPIMAITE